MTTKLFSFSRIAMCAGLLLWIPTARAAFVTIPTPNSAYTSSTTLIPIDGPDFATSNSLFDSNLTVTFSTEMEKFSVPVTWGAWNTPPAVENSTPNVLSPSDITVTTITLLFSQGLSTFGLEAEPDATSQGAFPVSLDFYNGAALLGTVSNTIDGSSAALFAGSSTTPITRVVLTISGNSADPAGTDPGIAQVRYALAATPTPEPGTLMIGAIGLALLMARRSRFARQ
jgi:hypothetical protein